MISSSRQQSLLINEVTIISVPQKFFSLLSAFYLFFFRPDPLFRLSIVITIATLIEHYETVVDRIKRKGLKHIIFIFFLKKFIVVESWT